MDGVASCLIAWKDWKRNKNTCKCIVVSTYTNRVGEKGMAAVYDISKPGAASFNRCGQPNSYTDRYFSASHHSFPFSYIYALSHSSLRAVAAAAAGLVSFRISRIEL